jgi:hypothetical protein
VTKEWMEKGKRKEEQEKNAHKKTTRAKLLKLADKTSNLRALASSPAPDWSVKRRLDYIDWACQVVDGLRGANKQVVAKRFPTWKALRPAWI